MVEDEKEKIGRTSIEEGMDEDEEKKEIEGEHVCCLSDGQNVALKLGKL